MKEFLNKFSIFILLFIILLFALDWPMSYLLKQSNQSPAEYEVINDIYEGNIECDVAIYGSSRAWVHINPIIIEDSLNLSTYNFGIDGHNFWLQYMRNLEFLKHNTKPKIIILSLDMMTLHKNDDLYNQNQFLPYMLWNKTIKEFTSSYIGFNSIDYFIPFVRYYGRKSVLTTCFSVLINNDGNKKFRYKGYRGTDSQWNTDFDKAKEEIENYSVVLDTASVKLFEEFILECKKSKIKLVLVYTPEYIEGQNFVTNRASIIKLYSDFADKYQLIFLDYSNSSLCSNKKLFYNTMHLNSEGADIFTRQLVDDIKNKFTVIEKPNGP